MWRGMRYLILAVLLVAAISALSGRGGVMGGIFLYAASGAFFGFALGIVVTAIVRLAVGLLLRLGIDPRRRKPTEVEDVFGETPLSGWKVARVQIGDKPFVPIVSPHRYAATETAHCEKGGDGPPPHDNEPLHHCGFYAYLDRRSAVEHSFLRPDRALLQVELYGLVIEGTRKILRAQYQRVMGISFAPACDVCVWPIPRPAVAFSANRQGFVRPTCGRHEPPDALMSLADVRNLVKTGVSWQDNSLSRWSGRLWRM